MDTPKISEVSPQKIQVKVICDRSLASRPCLWRDIHKNYKNECDFYFIQLAEYIEGLANHHDTSSQLKPTELLSLFDNKLTNIIIFNWNSINGDPIYGSDRALQFFYHHASKLHNWVQNGGVVIVEAQATTLDFSQDSWYLSQGPYNIFSKNITVATKDFASKKIILNEEYMGYPIFEGFIKPETETAPTNVFTIEQHNTGESEKQWCPGNININDGMLSTGWFDSYPDNWRPLIFVEINRDSFLISTLNFINNWINTHKGETSNLLISVFKNVYGYIVVNDLKPNLKPVMLMNRVKTKYENQSKHGDQSTRYGAYIVTCMYFGECQSMNNPTPFKKIFNNLLRLPTTLKDHDEMKLANSKEKTSEKKKKLKHAKKVLTNFLLFGILVVVFISILPFFHIPLTYVQIAAPTFAAFITLMNYSK